eukprot:1187622-Prorocentrum_minimum.AAC.2
MGDTTVVGPRGVRAPLPHWVVGPRDKRQCQQWHQRHAPNAQHHHQGGMVSYHRTLWVTELARPALGVHTLTYSGAARCCGSVRTLDCHRNSCIVRTLDCHRNSCIVRSAPAQLLASQPLMPVESTAGRRARRGLQGVWEGVRRGLQGVRAAHRVSMTRCHGRRCSLRKPCMTNWPA